MISEYAQDKIADGDVILVHGGSELLLYVLKAAFNAGKKFSIMIIDSRPKLKGQFASLVEKGQEIEPLVFRGGESYFF